MAKVLVVEDDLVIADLICDFLEAEKFSAEKTHNGRDALHLLRTYSFDIVILDWELPDTSGPEICKEFRARGGHTPILFLTGKATVEDKATGLDSGADDYLTKPFHVIELGARLRALLRRQSGAAVSDMLSAGAISLDRAGHKVFRGTEEVALLPREFAVLEYLMVNKGRVLSAEAILDHVWETTSDATPDAVRTVVTRLRKKLDANDEPSLITTVYGVGYKIEQDK